MPGSFASLHCHVVFSTKGRAPLITPQVAERLYAYLGGTARGKGDMVLQVGGTADHVHLLLSLPANRTVADAVRDLRANSSRWLHEQFPQLRAFAWQEGYAAFSIAFAGIERVRAYIAHQEQHHHTVSFEEELRSFLKRHNIAHDEGHRLA